MGQNIHVLRTHNYTDSSDSDPEPTQLHMLHSVLVVVLILALVQKVYPGHEVLYKLRPENEDLKNSELAIVQYDSRPLGSYWNTSARWNKAYADKHGHKYVYMSSKSSCRFGTHLLADAWCKVKAMVLVNDLTSVQSANAFLFIDSDAVITVNYSMATVLNFMRRDLHWNITERPVAINQDGPGSTLKLGYKVCLNSGAIFWMRSETSKTILQQWWISSGEPYMARNKFTSKWRQKWPWEQAQLYEIQQDHAAQIQILSFPTLPYLPWTSKDNPNAQYPTDTIEPYCFSHWPGAGCFITHHCASKNQKLKLMDNYDLPRVNIVVDVVYIDKRIQV